MAEENRSAPATDSHKETTEDRSHGSNQRRNIIIGVVVLAVLVVGGIFLWRYLGSYESTDDAQVDAHLYPVSARVAGYVTKVNVADNQIVEKGTVLVEIDPKDYEVAVAEAQANLANAEATAQSLNITVPITTVNTTSQLSVATSGVEDANTGIATAETQVSAARAQLEAAQATDAKAQSDVARYKMLAEKQEVSQQQYDQAIATAKASAATVAAARDNVAAAQQAVQQAQSRLKQTQANRQSAQSGLQEVSSSKARARAAIANVQQKRAAVEQAQLNLQYARIVAPVSGEVNKTVVEGMNVQPGQQLLTIVPLEEVWITANFKETQLRKMKVGQRAEIHADSSGRTFRGHVDSISGATGPLFSLLPPENATGNYVKIVQRIPVKIILEPGENQDHQLRPGMNVVPDVYLQ
ncbi:MAG TPA: HlyD family secretion protein [Candidatus Acidoferrales bacterium]|jgi:membrane fusion protein (multidrug efflux system)|nr:HlyD family secretion protein [Candidatus Acidoferrales bacterium]HWF40434.1 HlyD family secretion protein [Candidatus Acidoferrales bacterium]